MKIVAGLGLDARRPNDTGSMLGAVAVGAAGLLEALEIRAGLVLGRQPQAERVVRYRNALTAADTSARFYHRSLGSDPVTSAQTLLNWRDFALDHGWLGTPGAGSPGRLSDLAEVEARVVGLSPCAAERVAALLPRLGWVAAAVEEIALLDPRSDWPVPHQRLFDALEGAGIPLLDCASPLVPGASDGTDLGSLQRCLTAEPAPTGPLSLAGDGTLMLLHCLDSQAGANALCLRLASQPNHLLIAGGDAFLLGAAACHRGFADPGLGEPSYWRPPLQLLPLVIQIAWSPPGAEALLQYLTLPAGPYRSLRRAIAKQFTDLPGHDLDVWQAEVDAFVQRRLEKDPAADEAGLRQGIHPWLPVGEAGSREAMTRDLAMRLVDQVAQYWRSRYGSLPHGELASAESRQYLAAFQAADALGIALRAWDGAEISREQLDRLLDMLCRANQIGEGCPAPFSPD